MTHREGPRNLGSATCLQHYSINTRPGALRMGHLLDPWGCARDGRENGGGEYVVAKVGTRTPRKRELARDPLPASPTRVDVLFSPSL